MGQGLEAEYLTFSLDALYPLTYRPFGRYWYPAPARPVQFLSTYYGSGSRICESSIWSHAMEMDKNPAERPCKLLLDKYAFVQRCARAFTKNTMWPLPRLWQFKKTPVLVDEHLVGGDGKSIHIVRTILSVGETASSGFTVRPSSFYCGTIT